MEHVDQQSSIIFQILTQVPALNILDAHLMPLTNAQLVNVFKAKASV
jgi:hypothetical protein